MRENEAEIIKRIEGLFAGKIKKILGFFIASCYFRDPTISYTLTSNIHII
jgi:hypothetical protein